MKQYGLIGYPLTHSFSKKYFTEKFKREGIADCAYELFPVTEIEAIKNLIANTPALAGFNITIPYKRQIISYTDDVSHLPEGIAACNCIKITDGKLIGYNTDIIGFEKSLSPLVKPHHTKALILGNGGAAAAIKFVLSKLGITYTIVSRKLHDEACITYAAVSEKIMQEHLLIINTTPVGTYPAIDEAPAIPYQFITAGHLLYDVVYNPEKTLFLQKGEEQGAAIKNGHEMLVLQAEASWEIWNEGLPSVPSRGGEDAK